MAFINWIAFIDGSRGCILQPPDHPGKMSFDEASKLAEEITGKKVISLEGLPYPASPVLNQNSDWPAGWAMTLCFDPENCKGRSSCPKRRACSE